MEIEKDSSYLFKHQLSDQTRQALDQLNQMKGQRATWKPAFQDLFGTIVYDYGEYLSLSNWGGKG